MKRLTSAELKEIALDIEVELGQLARLRADIEKVNQLMAASLNWLIFFTKIKLSNSIIFILAVSAFFRLSPPS
jgi:hypothetical protein